MDETTFKRRTRDAALRVIELVETLPRNTTNDVIARQLVRAATSVGANYRASCRGRSVKEILAKLAIVEEEADEASYWLELLVGCGALPAARIQPLAAEFDEILAMTVSSQRTLKRRIGARGFSAAES
jgi:four helix bundle protein